MNRMSRDQGRTPVQWDASDQAGFTAGTPWIAVNPDYVDVNAAAQVGRDDSVFEHYRRLIALRHADPVVTDGEFELLLPEHPAIWAFLRRGRDAELLVAANFSAEPVSVTLPLDPPAGRTPRSCWPAIPTGRRGTLPELALAPWESVVWRRALGLIGRENAKHATVRDNRL